MKVLFVTSEHPENQFGGLGSFTRDYVKELKKTVEVVAVYLHYSSEIPPEPGGAIDYVLVPEKKFPSVSIEGNILETAASFQDSLERIVLDFKPDVIHCNDRQTYLPFRFKKNVVYSSHLMYTDLIGMRNLNDIYFPEQKIERLALENSGAVIAYSDFSAERILKNSRAENIFVLPLGINTELISRFSRAGKKLDQKILKGKELTIGYFGRLENVQKGFLKFIEAVNILGKKFKIENKVKYVIFGRGKIPACIDISLIDRSGYLKQEDLYREMAETDIMVMPSNYEPFGLAGIEAMASGALLLCTKGLGMDSYAVYGKNALAIPENPAGIASVLETAVKNYDKMERLISNGISEGKTWSWKRSVNAHLQIYEKVRQKMTRSFSYKKYFNIVQKFNNAELYLKNSVLRKIDTLIQKHIAESNNMLFITCGTIWDSEEKMVSVTHRDSNFVVSSPEIILRNLSGAVCFIGSWEFVSDPRAVFRQLIISRVEKVIIYYWNGDDLPWQILKMESYNDFVMLLDGFSAFAEFSFMECSSKDAAPFNCIEIGFRYTDRCIA